MGPLECVRTRPVGGLVFDRASHRYSKDGRLVWQSVTQVLRRAGLFDWMLSVPDAVMQRARDRGTIVHEAIHYLNENDLDVEEFRANCADLRGYLDGWITFCERESFRPVFCEHRVYSTRYDLAGTIDCLGLLDGRAVLVDFATGLAEDTSKDLQSAGYLLLAREWAESDDAALREFFAEHAIVRRAAVQLRPEGTYRVVWYTDPIDFRHFLALVEAQSIVDARVRSARLAEVV